MFLWVHGYLEKDAGTHVRKVLFSLSQVINKFLPLRPLPQHESPGPVLTQRCWGEQVSSDPGAVPCVGTSSGVPGYRTAVCAAQAEQPVR